VERKDADDTTDDAPNSQDHADGETTEAETTNGNGGGVHEGLKYHEALINEGEKGVINDC